MTMSRHDKILFTWKKLKTSKIKMKIKQNKEKNLLSWITKIINRLGYKLNLYKERRFKPFCG